MGKVAHTFHGCPSAVSLNCSYASNMGGTLHSAWNHKSFLCSGIKVRLPFIAPHYRRSHFTIYGIDCSAQRLNALTPQKYKKSDIQQKNH